jgi:hypothetical protein
LRTCIPAWISIFTCSAGILSVAYSSPAREPIIFATFAADSGSLDNVLILAESIRAFGGRYKDAPIRAYMPPGLAESEPDMIKSLERLGVEPRTADAPEEALWFYFARKIFASAEAEKDATGGADVLAWLDEDTIFFDEPHEFRLPEGKSLGYRPVMHKNVGLLFDDPMDEFWGRAFDLLSVPDSSLYPMVTPADGDTIKPYINAGCLAIRPGCGLMDEWVECFKVLYSDSALTEMCRADVKKRIFIHQIALAGAVLRHFDRKETLELSAAVNYPIFFEQMFGAKRVFDDITGVVTIRHESYFRDPAPDWDRRLKGPADRIAWMKQHLAKPPAAE